MPRSALSASDRRLVSGRQAGEVCAIARAVRATGHQKRPWAGDLGKDPGSGIWDLAVGDLEEDPAGKAALSARPEITGLDMDSVKVTLSIVANRAQEPPAISGGAVQWLG